FGAKRIHVGTNTQRFKFAGQMIDEPLGILYLRARYYDPATGRFLSRDSWPGFQTSSQTLNRFVYGNNNPALYTDPLGLFGVIDGVDWFITALEIAGGEKTVTSPSTINKAVGTAAKEAEMTGVIYASKGIGAGL